MDAEYTELANEEYDSTIIFDLYTLDDVKRSFSSEWEEFLGVIRGDNQDEHEESISGFLDWYEDDSEVLNHLITADKRQLIQLYVQEYDGTTIILEVKPIIIYMKEK